MKKTFLLANSYKKIGWVIFVPSFTLGLIVLISSFQFSFLDCTILNLFPSNFSDNCKTVNWYESVNLTNTIVGILVLVGALLVGFSKEKQEDEYIGQMRLASLLWAVLVNYCLLILAFVIVYDFTFLTVMTYNMFTVLLLFIFRFHYLLYCSKIATDNAE